MYYTHKRKESFLGAQYVKHCIWATDKLSGIFSWYANDHVFTLVHNPKERTHTYTRISSFYLLFALPMLCIFCLCLFMCFVVRCIKICVLNCIYNHTRSQRTHTHNIVAFQSYGFLKVPQLILYNKYCLHKILGERVRVCVAIDTVGDNRFVWLCTFICIKHKTINLLLKVLVLKLKLIIIYDGSDDSGGVVITHDTYACMYR